MAAIMTLVVVINMMIIVIYSSLVAQMRK
jgi:hypothetical protein